MDDIGGGPVAGPNLVDRVKNILLKPKEEWPRIDAEPATIGGLYRSYVIPLAAIGPVAGAIGRLVFGYPVIFGVVIRPSPISVISGAIVQYVLALVSVFVLALVIDALAPTFGGAKNQVQAFKVAAYSATASWVAGIFGIVPALAILSILGLYSLYLLYLGLPKLMKVAQDKAVAYVAVVIVAMIVLFLIIGAVAASVTGAMIGGYGGYGAYGAAANPDAISGTMALPGVGSVDLGKLDAASKQMAAAANRMQASANGAPVATAGAAALPPATLQTLLPAALPGGMARTSLSSASAGAAGIGGSSAEARYGAGPSTIKLAVTDLGGMAGLAALGGAFNVQSSRQDADGYEKTGQVDGRMTSEKWTNASRSGSYSMLVANRFMVEADGEGTTVDMLKAAVAQIDLAKLEGLARG